MVAHPGADGALEADFISGSRGRILLLAHRPAASRGCVLVVPPFADEMNKCRALVTTVALELLKHQVTTAIVDLYGTGDSAGDFSEADWPSWQADLQCAARECERRGFPVTGILATRLGAALAVSAMQAGLLPAVTRTVWWQPVLDGRRFLQQFLRMRVAARLADEDQRETVSDLRAELAAGGTVEVAGYPLPGRLGVQLDSLEWPQQLPTGLGRLRWIEVVREASATIPSPVTRLADHSRSAGMDVQVQTVVGDPFWTATEIIAQPALTAATVDAFAQPGARPA